MNLPNISEERIDIGGIPALLYRPAITMAKYPTVIFYHGWTSNKETQRFRGFILSCLGYQVLIPDSIYHGERGRIDYLNTENPGAFWEVVLKSLEESELLIQALVDNFSADPKRIAVSGHSMGGFISAGIFAQKQSLKTMVIFNGSCNWSESNEIFKNTLKFNDNESYLNIENRMLIKDPGRKLDLLKDRLILFLHGEVDTVVDIEPQRNIYSRLKELYNDETRLKMITYKNLNHHITTNMMEEMGKWLEKYL